MSLTDLAVLALLGAGLAFYGAGSLGLLRFPDTASRLHALTKADNLGLGFLVAGLMLQAANAQEVLKLLLVWLLVLFASSVACYLVARSATASAARADGGAPAAGGDDGR